MTDRLSPRLLGVSRIPRIRRTEEVTYRVMCSPVGASLGEMERGAEEEWMRQNRECKRLFAKI